MKLRNEILRLIFGLGLTVAQEIAGVTKRYMDEKYRDEGDSDGDKRDTKDQ